MKLTLKQAISKRDELTRDLKRWNELMQTYNTRQNHTHNIHDYYSNIVIGNQNLEQLKLLVLSANFKNDMYARIYALRSLTTQRSNLQALSKKVTYAGGDVAAPLMSQEEIQLKIDELDQDIIKLKEELDAFNNKTIVEYSPIVKK